MLPSLKQVLPVPMQEELLSPRVCFHGKKRINTLEELLEAHPEFKELLVDATEQEVPKPKTTGRTTVFGRQPPLKSGHSE